MANIKSIIKNIPDTLSIDSFNAQRVMPNAILLATKKPSKKGLFWFEPKQGILDFSKEAKTHFDIEKFVVKKPIGWIRGVVFEKDNVIYVLIHKADFLKETKLTGSILKRIYYEITEKRDFDIEDIFDEEGHSLIASVREQI
jgi:hypothetical protein